MEATPTMDRVLLQAFCDEIVAAYPDKYVYYHYNPAAVISGPMIFFNWCTFNKQHSDNRWTKVAILFHDGDLYITQDRQPARKPENVIARFDFSAPSFDAEDIIKALRVYYESGGADKRYTALPHLGKGRP